MKTTDITVERGSGNVFADIDLPDADAHLLKAELVSRIDTIVRERGMTQTEAARLLGLSQPDVSRLLRGDFREYSLERLFRLMTHAWARYRHRHPPAAFGRRRKAPRRRHRARLTPIVPAPAMHPAHSPLNSASARRRRLRARVRSPGRSGCATACRTLPE